MPLGIFRLNSIGKRIGGAAGLLSFNSTLAYTKFDNATGTRSGDSFGRAANVSDSYFAFGASSEDVGGSGSGSVYVYNVSDGTLEYTLANPNLYDTVNSDAFGWSVALTDSYIIVGAPFEDDAGGTSSGAAYVFDLSDGSVVYSKANENASGTSASDAYGRGVAINSTYFAVTAPFEDAGGSGSGSVYVYNLSDGTLNYTINDPNNYDTPNNDNLGTLFRKGIAMSENYLVVAAENEDDSGGLSSGVVYVFDVSDGSLVYTFTNPNNYSTSNLDRFGSSVALNDDYVIVGARTEDDANGSDNGVAYLYRLSDGSLVHTFTNPNYDSSFNGDAFGQSVAINNQHIWVGAPNESDSTSTNSGVVYGFNISDYSLQYTLVNPNDYDTGYLDRFGETIAASNNVLVAGTPSEDDASGTGSGVGYVWKYE